MRKNHYSFLLIVLLYLLTACENNGKIKVAFLLPHTKIDRYLKEKVYFEKRIQELGGEFYFASAEYDQELQVKQAREFLEKGIKVIVISPVNSNLTGEIVRLGHEYNAKIISYDRLILNADVDYCITFRYKKVGESMVNYCTNLRPKGKYMIFGGDKSDFNALQISLGQQGALQSFLQSGSIEIQYNSFIEEWKSDNAYNTMEKFLRLSDERPDVVICSGEKLTMGVYKALQQYGLEGKVLLTGMDPDKGTYQRMMSDVQIVSIYKPIKKLATTAAEFAFSCASNLNQQIISDSLFNGKLSVPTIFLDPIITDKNNVKTVLIGEGMYAESDF